MNARASVRAASFCMHALTNASVLPGIGVDATERRDRARCCCSPLFERYVALSGNTTQKRRASRFVEAYLQGFQAAQQQIVVVLDVAVGLELQTVHACEDPAERHLHFLAR